MFLKVTLRYFVPFPSPPPPQYSEGHMSLSKSFNNVNGTAGTGKVKAMCHSVGLDIEPREDWNDTELHLPRLFLSITKPPNLHHNRLRLRQSSVILWFYYSIFKPVEWECFWVPGSHRWWWEDAQEYACSKCPFHYVITSFTFHMNRVSIILQTG